MDNPAEHTQDHPHAKNMSQRFDPPTRAEALARTRQVRFKKNNPESECRRKEKQLQTEAVIRFHVVREHLYSYPLPDFVDPESAIYKRVREAYMENEVGRPVEVTKK